MPLFAVHALDKADALPTRMEHYAAHRTFLEGAAAHGVELVMSGPLQSDDGEIMIGSLFVMSAETRDAVVGMLAADPFHTEHVWGSVTITRFHRRKG